MKCFQLSIAVLAFALSMSVRGTAQQASAPTRQFAVRDECTFNDGTKIMFGQKALGQASGAAVWRTGDFEATAFRVTARTIIPPVDRPIDLAPGLYTIFVDASKGEPWTLIVSRKSPRPGTRYPGSRYDVGRTSMGFDDSARAPVHGFAIGCRHWGQRQENPIFVWMESGIHVGYVKIQTMNTAF